MYSRKCDRSIGCGDAEGSQDGEKSELHVDERSFDRKVFDDTFWRLYVSESCLCCCVK